MILNLFGPKNPNVNFDNKTLVCVLGMHRSGTSALTRLVNACGVYLGKNEELMPSTEDNPKGYFEHNHISFLNDQLFTENNASWRQLEKFKLRKLKRKSLQAYLEKTGTALKQLFSQHDIAGVKDPRMCILLPLWLKYFNFKKIVVIHIFRNPTEVALSLQKRDQNFSHERVAKLWEIHVTSQLKAAENLESIAVSHIDLLQQPLKVTSAIENFLKPLSHEIHAADPETVKDFITDKLHRNRDQSTEYLTPEQLKLWEHCQKNSLEQ